MASDLSVSGERSKNCCGKFVLVTLLLLGAIFSTALLQQGWWRLFVAVLGLSSFSVVLLSARFKSDERSLVLSGLLLGASLPLLNIFGSGALLALECVILAALAISRPLSYAWALPWLGIIAVSFCADLYWSFDTTLLASLTRSPSSIFEALQAARLSPPVFVITFLTFCRWLTLIGFFVIAASSSIFISSFMRALVPALVVSLFILLLQYGFGVHSFISTQDSYWAALNRYAGSFTDPNAFALVGLLFLGLCTDNARVRDIIQRSKGSAIVGTCFLILAICFSGSRTLLAGLALVFVSMLPFKRQFLIGATITLFTLAIILAQFSPRQIDSLRGAVPESIVRVVETLHPTSAKEALRSRAVYADIGFEMWRDNPLYGVGLGRFRQYQPRYAKQAGVDIGSWLDNANNFYLGVLAELGLCGAFCLIVTVASLTLSAASTKVGLARQVLIIFLLVLFLGPHLDFDEVSLLFALVAAKAGVIQREAFALKYRAVLALILILIIPFRAITIQGIGSRESSPEGDFVWSARTARYPVVCDAQGNYQFDFRAPHPGLAEKPLRVQITLFETERVLMIADHARHQELLPCRAAGVAAQSNIREILELTVDSTFVPDKTHKNGDLRRLGVQIYSPVL